MTHPRWNAWRTDLLLASGLPLLVACDSLLRESYHQVADQGVRLIGTFAGAIAAALTIVVSSRWLRPAAHGLLVRIVVLVVMGLTLRALAGAAIAETWHSSGSMVRLAMVVLAGAALGLAAMLAFRQEDERWSRLRSAMAVGLVLFVGSEPVLGQLHARDVRWMPGFNAASADADRGRLVTIVLLLDELNARHADSLVDELRASGLAVARAAVPSIGGSTAVVVPAMFDGRRFDGARACGRFTICGSNVSLDFSRVSASRPDVDVVGFFHPYCAISGLRSCWRAEVESALRDPVRWRCGISRRAPWLLSEPLASCRDVHFRTWVAMTNSIVEATIRAPALREGGILFAHVPLPHPPGIDPAGSLSEHYRDNLSRTAGFLRELLSTARGSGLRTRVVIFSDHPLRQAHWCQSFAPYRWSGCTPDERLSDTRVPLIVAGESAPDLVGFRDNLRVFELPAAWNR